ncbi:hypothetical protein [Vibrio agarivorans]|uniref:Uncharacterized protein n=1 Tax=Vibrio agarivorans TaxID=153622 RepID=A0ABT7Y7F4_9VIBR|nr:hypothetical protein [Vibrio agarivorans]MDN2483986.1 hypothetical protein [Vibrio agarivorans]
MQKPSKSIWIEILQAIPNDEEMGVSNFNVLLSAYNRGYENSLCGFDAKIEQLFNNPSEAILIAYMKGFENGRDI